MTKDGALKLALDAADCIYSPLHVREIEKIGSAMKAIKEALAQSDQESDDLTLAYMSGLYDGGNKDAQQRKPLTDEQLIAAYESEQQGRYGDHIRSLRAIEAAHGIKE